MQKLTRTCAEYGVAVRFGELGSWGGDVELRSEYDPGVPEIVVNRHTATHLVAQAIAHELYHHKEAIGDVARLSTRAERESAADAYATHLLEELR